MPAAMKRPTLDELYRRLRYMDYTQVDERMAVMLKAILQLEEQGECRESATEVVLMVGYTTDGISNQEQTRWLSWNVDGGVRGFDQQQQRVRENAANCEQLKSELERIQRRQRELDMQKGARPKKRTATGSRPESRMEVDEASRSKGRFNLERAAQEHINEGLEVWIPTESTSSLPGLETQPIRLLMDVALPGYTPSSNPSGSQVSGSSSRLKELNERLQLRNR